MRALQIIIPFLIAGFGTCLAGIILDHVQYWSVFQQVDELLLLLPALLSLKGNLQMTLASRFSTHSQMGHIQTREDLLKLTCANLSVNQCFTIVISICASILSLVIHFVATESPFNGKHALLVTTSALLTSSVTSFLLDLLMVLVIQVSAMYKINPDNVATPIAASLGDTTALVLCSFLAQSFYNIKELPAFWWLTSIVILFYTFLVPFWANIAQENIHTYKILEHGSYWLPLLTAMTICSISGIILNIAITRSRDIALFQPIICGVGGNLVAVQASRLSTFLHKSYIFTKIPDGESVCLNPIRLFISNGPGFQIARLLMALVIPGHILFYFIAINLNSNPLSPSMKFLILYLTGAEIQVILLLYLAYVLTFALWKCGVDPDNCTIPYLTSISDVLGACIITGVCFVATNPSALPATTRLYEWTGLHPPVHDNYSHDHQAQIDQQIDK